MMLIFRALKSRTKCDFNGTRTKVLGVVVVEMLKGGVLRFGAEEGGRLGEDSGIWAARMGGAKKAEHEEKRRQVRRGN